MSYKFDVCKWPSGTDVSPTKQKQWKRENTWSGFNFLFLWSFQVKESLKNLILSDDQIQKVGEAFKHEMASALHEETSSLQMENTYIPELPNGTEEGTYLALDLGGTNFRVIYLELARGQILKEEFKFYHISDEARLACGLQLFDYLAECVKDFMKLKNMPVDMRIPMGFTFSFPMKQHSLHSAELVTWTKSFNCPSVVGCDVVQLLQTSLMKHGMTNIEVLCILNDTTGTLVICDPISILKTVLMAIFSFLPSLLNSYGLIFTSMKQSGGRSTFG